MRSARLLLIATFSIFPQLLFAQLAATTVVVTNESFVRNCLKEYFTEMLDSASIRNGTEVVAVLQQPPRDNLNVTGNALTLALDEAQIHQLAESSESGTRLEIDVDDLSMSYHNRGGGLFSRGEVHRVLHVSASFRRLRDGAADKQDFLIRDFEERISLSNIDVIEDRSSPFFFAQLPPGPVQRLWEPVIVTSVIGGLVYLFFASR